MSQGGVRWYRSRWAASSATNGTNWAALAPVPITATRLPAQCDANDPTRAEWNDGPPNRSRPAMGGNDGRLSWPTALTSTSNRSVWPVPSAPPELDLPSLDPPS